MQMRRGPGRDLRAGRNGHPHESPCGVRLEFQQTANLIASQFIR